MNIKQKIFTLPNPYADTSRDVSDMFVGYVRGLADSAKVAQLHMDRIELAQKFNLEAMEEASAGLAEQLLAERAKVDALIAEIRALPVKHFDSSVYGSIDQDSVDEILDKWSTK